jgi:uncharacterized protein
VNHALKRCTVVYALPQRQYRWALELPATARISDALAAARALESTTSVIPWDSAPVGIFGEPRQRSDDFADGDRIELYRPLASDPRARRRARVQRERRGAR